MTIPHNPFSIRGILNLAQNMLSLSEHLSSSRVLVGFMLRNISFSVQCFVNSFCPFVLFIFGHCLFFDLRFSLLLWYLQLLVQRSNLRYEISMLVLCNARSIKSKGKYSMARNQEECWSSTQKISSSYHRNVILLSP